MATIQLMVRVLFKNNNNREYSCALKRKKESKVQGVRGGGGEGAKTKLAIKKQAH